MVFMQHKTWRSGVRVVTPLKENLISLNLHDTPAKKNMKPSLVIPLFGFFEIFFQPVFICLFLLSFC